MMRWWLGPILVVCLLTVGCQGDSDESTAEVTESAPLPTSLALPTPEADPTITDSQFDYPAKGYSVRIPEGWTNLPNITGTAALTVDAFFAPSEEQVGDVQPNISVMCEATVEGTTLDDYFEGKRLLMQRITGVEPEVSETEVSGQPAYAMQYHRELQDPRADYSDVVFMNERCAWTIRLLVPEGKRSDYEATLNDFVASFRLLP
jgi:hypothetical protein